MNAWRACTPRREKMRGKSADMKWIYTGIAVFVVVLIAGVFVYLQAQHDITGDVVDLRGQKEVKVVLTDKGFEPQAIRITEGTRVTFTTTRSDEFWPASDPHPTHTDYPEFDPLEPIQPGASWSFVFDKIGRWGYHDHIRSYFSGTIYVDPPQS